MYKVERFRASVGTLVIVSFDAIDALKTEHLRTSASANVGLFSYVIADRAFVLFCFLVHFDILFGFEGLHLYRFLKLQ